MDASLTLRRPSNWQDFETLCKKLWGEIWNCPEIKKNGRAGQAQHGVDVYGIPFGEDKYYGIQCKGKDEYTTKQFSEDEITSEIEKAKKFQPSLKKLYFATTAIKDARIEEFVRKQNIDNISKGFFEVHIFSWEDIVELIDENKRTHDFYVKNQNYKTSKSVVVNFQDGSAEIILIPKYNENVNIYMKENNHPYKNSIATIMKNIETAYAPISGTKVNLSYCKIGFKIRNTGLDPIEEYRLLFEFEGEVLDLRKSNEEYYGIAKISNNHNIIDIDLCSKPFSGKVVPKNTILVSDDTYISNYFFIKPLAIEYNLVVNWKLISKDFKDEGKLKIIIRPVYEKKHKIVFVEDPSEIEIIEDNKFEEVIVEKEYNTISH